MNRPFKLPPCFTFVTSLFDKVRDHDHLQQGHNYRGAAHNACNLNYKPAKFIPVVFHNLRGYDSHIILSGVGKIPSDKISCIPNNMEKYISFYIGSLRFVDSLQFLNASLETLVKIWLRGLFKVMKLVPDSPH